MSEINSTGRKFRDKRGQRKSLTKKYLSDIKVSMEDIGRELKALIKKQGVSVYKMADDLGLLNESLYRSLKNGANPEWKRIRQILDYLGFDLKFVRKREVVKASKPKSRKRRR